MDVPLEIVFDNVQPSEFVEQRVRERAAKLERIYTRLVTCRVAVGIPHKQHGKGNVPVVRIEMSVPGNDLVVRGGAHHARERYRDHGVLRIVDDAFDVAERRLQDFKKQQYGQTKQHETDSFMLGVVSELRPDAGQGFLMSAEGRELWFHRNAVVNGSFDDLKVDDAVHYVENVGESGPQASRVWVVGSEGDDRLPPQAADQRPSKLH